jgi:PadR family transcriptional regulator, regulatory protein PadR
VTRRPVAIRRIDRSGLDEQGDEGQDAPISHDPERAPADGGDEAALDAALRGASVLTSPPTARTSFRGVLSVLFRLFAGLANRSDVKQGTLALMVLRTLKTMEPLHGYGIARRIEQTSGQLLAINYGTLYPALLKLEQEGAIEAEWSVSENNRKAKYYRLTRAGRRRVAQETGDWRRTSAILGRFLAEGEQS